MFGLIRKTGFIILLSLLMVACSSEPEVDIEATVASSLSATQMAMPTATDIPPTNTPIPTETAVPTDTPTSVPTEMAVPTNTPAPTNTPEPTSTPIPEANIIETVLDSGEILYEIPNGGFSLALPPEWKVLDLESDNFADALGSVGEQNESLSFLSTDYARTLIASGMKFYALNIDRDSLITGNPISINVVTEELPFDLTVEEYATIVIGQFEQLLGVDEQQMEVTPITLDDQEGVRITYVTQMINAVSIPIETSNTHYVFVHDGYAYFITVGVLTELEDQYLKSARAAAETFRFLEESK